MDNPLLIDILKLIGGLIILIFSGDYLVRGGVAIANHFKVSTLIVGLTVVAFGTSAPELIVSTDAALTGHPELALGNVIGSNIANIALVLALTVIILPMTVAKSTIKNSWPVMFISAILLYLTMLNNIIGRTEGLILFGLLLLFIFYSIKRSKSDALTNPVAVVQARYPLALAIGVVLLASGGLALGSRLLVTGASSLASHAGISERVISLTVVAFGTSIPELTASIIAAVKKESDISVGNIIGSNIFNVYAVIGITSMIHPIQFNFADFKIDLITMLVISFLLFAFMAPYKTFFSNGLISGWKKIESGQIGRAAGIILVLIYAAYIYSIL